MMRCYCALWISAIPLPCTILWSCQWHNKNRKWQLIHLSLSCVFFYVLHLCAEIMTRCVVYDSTCYSEHMLSFQEPKKIKSKYAIGWWHLLALIQFDKRCFSTKNGINVLSVGNATKKCCTPPTCQQCPYSQTQRSVLVSSTHLKLSLVFFAT